MTTERRKVLVVDDEESVRNLLRRILEDAGYEVVMAASGEEALRRISMMEMPLVTLDVKMPGMSGVETLSRITALQTDACVIMVTAVMETETAIEAMKLGAYDYLIKPFDRETVVKKIQQAVAKWSSQQQEKKRYVELREKFLQKTELMQQQFNELVESLAREHRLIIELAGKGREDIKQSLSNLPAELRKPIANVDEFRDALIRILRRT